MSRYASTLPRAKDRSRTNVRTDVSHGATWWKSTEGADANLVGRRSPRMSRLKSALSASQRVVQKIFRQTALNSPSTTSIAAQALGEVSTSHHCPWCNLAISTSHPPIQFWLALQNVLPPISLCRRLHSFYLHHSGVIFSNCLSPRQRHRALLCQSLYAFQSYIKCFCPKAA
jgi:hypothetical protein